MISLKPLGRLVSRGRSNALKLGTSRRVTAFIKGVRSARTQPDPPRLTTFETIHQITHIIHDRAQATRLTGAVNLPDLVTVDYQKECITLCTNALQQWFQDVAGRTHEGDLWRAFRVVGRKLERITREVGRLGWWLFKLQERAKQAAVSTGGDLTTQGF